jgi:hypothetical protein
VIHRDIGGDLGSYALYFSLIKRQGAVVKLEDVCWSACTLVLSNPNACAMPRAQFGFHEARLYSRSTLEVMEVSEHGNRILWDSYPEKVKAD